MHYTHHGRTAAGDFGFRLERGGCFVIISRLDAGANFRLRDWRKPGRRHDEGHKHWVLGPFDARWTKKSYY